MNSHDNDLSVKDLSLTQPSNDSHQSKEEQQKQLLHSTQYSFNYSLSFASLLKLFIHNPQLGARSHKRNPFMNSQLLATRHHFDLFSPNSLLKSLFHSLPLVYSTAFSKGSIFFLMPNKSLHYDSLSLPYDVSVLTETPHWLNGSLSNFSELKKHSSLHPHSLFFDASMLPDLIVFLNNTPQANLEASNLDIPAIHIADSDNNPLPMQYPVFSNNHSSTLLQQYILLFEKTILLAHITHILNFSSH